jgi:hypothetical protein
MKYLTCGVWSDPEKLGHLEQGADAASFSFTLVGTIILLFPPPGLQRRFPGLKSGHPSRLSISL